MYQGRMEDIKGLMQCRKMVWFMSLSNYHIPKKINDGFERAKIVQMVFMV